MSSIASLGPLAPIHLHADETAAADWHAAPQGADAVLAADLQGSDGVATDHDDAQRHSGPSAELAGLDVKDLVRFGSDFDLGPTACEDLSSSAGVDKVLPRVPVPNIDFPWAPPMLATSPAGDALLVPPTVDAADPQATSGTANATPLGLIPMVLRSSAAAESQPNDTSAASLPPDDAEGGL